MSAAGEARGFTLLELLVVLAVLGLVSGLAFPAIERAQRRQAFAAMTVRLEGVLRGARARAVREHGPVRLDADADGHGLSGGGAARFAGATLTIAPAGGIAFFADGSADGGEVALAADGRTARWRIAAAGGAIRRAA